MNTCILLKDLTFSITPDEILKKLNLSREENIEIVNKLTNEALKIAAPKAIFKECFISKRGINFIILDGIKFNSRVISVNLCEEDRTFPYIVTCGTELKHWSDSKRDKFEKKTAEFITQELLVHYHSLLKII